MGAFRHLLQADLRRLFKTPSVPILWLAFPLALSLIEYSAFGQLGRGATGMPKGDLLLVDQDRTLLSSFFEQALHRPPMSDFFAVVHVDSSRSAGKELSHDEGSAALYVPKGFQDSVLAGGHIALTYVPNAMEEIKPKMIESTLRTFLEIANRFLHEGQDAMKLLGAQTKLDRAPTRLEVLAMSGAFYDVGQRFRKLDALGDLDVKVQRPPPKPGNAATSGNSMNFFAYFLPGLLLFSLLMVAQGFERRAFVLRERGLVRRIATSPVSPAVVVAAHASGVLAAAIATGVIVLGLGTVLFHIPLQQPGTLAIVLLGFGLYAVGLMKTIYAASRSKRSAETLGSVVSLLTTLIGGGFAPIEIYAQSVRPFASSTPVGCASTSMVNALVHGQSLGETAHWVVGTWIWAAVFGALGFALSWRHHVRQ